ncbi:type II secretion system F family protein [Paenibacillus thiaminolyticus]|uniref:type II secretion system F family protein n=1 Tax=Paenibacillus thiaminolyticus TaxID=49283 RepID=UPI0011656B9C|nr:type II secretion system F family protein [Paenibacillus thiaminolyticus]NGP58003.1 type II secretion system F family protein [Paenibacillus thiaminolyticus]WCR26853.1 type II secretion system F family protein [Paenibacillus thiaminolyticus]
MATFQFKAVDEYGARRRGVVKAATKKQAAEQLQARNWWVTKLEDRKSHWLHRDITLGGPRVKVGEMTVFCRQLATMARAGIPLAESIRVLEGQTDNKSFSAVLHQVLDDLESGTSLSQAAERTPGVFSQMFVNMVKAGEASGKLDEMLERLAVFYEKEHQTREKVKSAMIYPIIMLVMTVVVVTVLMIFVIPKLVLSFTSMDIELPLPTRVVMAISGFMVQYSYLVIPGLVLLPFACMLLLKLPRMQYPWDKAKLRFPILGKLQQKQALARFTRTFASLFSAAIPIVDTLTIAARVTGNEVYGRIIRAAREDVKSGRALSDTFEEHAWFPPMLVQMMGVGERTGNLDEMMEKVADFYERDVETMSDRLKSMLEPLMIVILAVIVGFIVLAVMLPSFKLMDNLR